MAQDFESILDEAIALLRRRGRVTYRALKRQFDLSDDFVDDLKEELIEGQRVAEDEAGKVLVWVGGNASPTLQSADIPATTTGVRGEAERRQLTVMFCDLVGSTALAEAMDPEVYRDLLRDYQSSATQAITRYEGYIARYMGDGLLVYFGYPQAHEDDAERAVRAALDAVDAVSHLKTSDGTRLQVRIGIATGLVVVGDIIGEGSSEEHAVLGGTPNLAARLQGLAGENQVVIADATRRLVEGRFELEPLGHHAFKGIAEPTLAYRAITVKTTSRFDATATSGVAPLVGRDEEAAILERRWRMASAGEGQVVLVRGEPGIGKSRLAQVLLKRLEGQPHAVLRFQCSPYHTNSAFYPAIAQLQQDAGITSDDDEANKLQKLEILLGSTTAAHATDLPLLAALLSLTANTNPPLEISPQKQKEETINALVSRLEALAAHGPVLVLVEDVHWMDPSTTELFDEIINRVARLAVLVVVTSRLEFNRRWTQCDHLTELSLNRLGTSDVLALIARITDSKPLPDSVVDEIASKTDGVPLFVEELTKSVLESGLLIQQPDRFTLAQPLPALAIPATLQDTLTARLDRLAADKGVAQTAAALGREFDHEVLSAVCQLSDTSLERSLVALVDSGLVIQHGRGGYRFKHALVQDAAYGSMLHSKRRPLHARIADILEHRFASRPDASADVLAQHYTQADLKEDAIRCWLQAGQHASRTSAMAESLAHISKGLEVAQGLAPSAARNRHEYTLRKELGLTYISQMGWQAAPVAEHLQAAYELGQTLEPIDDLYPVVYGLWIHYMNRGDFVEADKWLASLHHDAESTDSADGQMVAHTASAIHHTWLSNYEAVRVHRQEVAQRYLPQRHSEFVYLLGNNPKVVSNGFWSWCAWILGLYDEAEHARELAEQHARELGHPFDLAWQLTVGSLTLYLNRDLERWAPRVAEVVALGDELGIPFVQLVFGPVWSGFTLMLQGQWREAAANMQQGIAVWESLGGGVALPLWKSQVGCCLCEAGDLTNGHAWLDQALVATSRGESWFEPEVRRLKGVWLLRLPEPDAAAAERCFLQALDGAREQKAKSWELRAAQSLAELWCVQQRPVDATALLESIVNTFDARLTTPDLVAARNFVQRLAN